jgi:hypothetical protein
MQATANQGEAVKVAQPVNEPVAQQQLAQPVKVANGSNVAHVGWTAQQACPIQQAVHAGQPPQLTFTAQQQAVYPTQPQAFNLVNNDPAQTCRSCCRANWCGHRPYGSLLGLVIGQIICFLFDIISVLIYNFWYSETYVGPWMLEWVAYPGIVCSFLVTFLAMGRAGCCEYHCEGCRGDGKLPFHDFPKAKTAYGLGVAALVFFALDIAVVWWGFHISYLTLTWPLIAHSLGLASTILFCQNEKTREKTKPTQ